MNKGILIFNGVLLVLVAILFYFHFSGTEKKPATARVGGMQQPASNSAGSGNFRIGYFEWDSVTTRFDLFKQMQTEISQREEGNERQKMNLRQQYQDKYNSYAQRELSATESEAATQEMKNLEMKISSQMQRMDQELTDYTVRKQKEVKSKIEDFLKEYTRTNQYSFIFANEPGLIFYRDTTYNITEDLIRGLNEKYPGKKKK